MVAVEDARRWIYITLIRSPHRVTFIIKLCPSDSPKPVTSEGSNYIDIHLRFPPILDALALPLSVYKEL